MSEGREMLQEGIARFSTFVPGERIVLAEYDARWPSEFEQEATALRDALGDLDVEIHHIGSTSIPGLIAKPVIDMILVVPSLDALDARSDAIVRLGYEARGEFGIAGRRYFPRTTDAGVRTHQVHSFAADDAHIQRHLDFRDYLRAHAAVREEYAVLKRALAARSGTDIERYADAKTPFIREVERRAVAWREAGGGRASRE